VTIEQTGKSHRAITPSDRNLHEDHLTLTLTVILTLIQGFCAGVYCPDVDTAAITSPIKAPALLLLIVPDVIAQLFDE